MPQKAERPLQPVKTRRPKETPHEENTLQHGLPAREAPGLWPANRPHADSSRQIQRLHPLIGNRVIQHWVAQPNLLSRLVEYNEVEGTGATFTDPEGALAAGTLPFTEEGWDGREIAQRLTQLNPNEPQHENVRCVETSFLVGLVQRGPSAVAEMIDNYLRRYRQGLRAASTPPRVKSWYRRSLARMEPLPAKIADKSMTYDDIGILLTEMYNVYGAAGDTGTFIGPEFNMARREGYRVRDINRQRPTREQVAEYAAELPNGGMLACGVEVDRRGTGQIGHRVQIGRYPDTGTLFFYDPWPVQGNQLIECSADLNEIEHYFTNPVGEAEEAEVEGGTMSVQAAERRSFSVEAMYSPPAEEQAENEQATSEETA